MGVGSVPPLLLFSPEASARVLPDSRNTLTHAELKVAAGDWGEQGDFGDVGMCFCPTLGPLGCWQDQRVLAGADPPSLPPALLVTPFFTSIFVIFFLLIPIFRHLSRSDSLS